MIGIKEGLSFDDVLIIPNYSENYSRKDCNTAGKLTKHISLTTPIIAANMDTVCGDEMAIALARLGGLGIIHRFNRIEEEVELVKRVKQFKTFKIEKPLTCMPGMTAGDVKTISAESGISGFLVEENGTLIGIVSRRDLNCAGDDDFIRNIMTKNVITAQFDISLEEAEKILEKNKIEKLPLVDEYKKIRGLITYTDIQKQKKYPHASVDKKGRLLVGAAIGVKDTVERARALIEAEADILVLDIAHGHNKRAIDAVRLLKKEFPNIPVVAGNVATARATEDLITAGADCIKVGIGPGAACTTRIVTGCGVPQITAIIDCATVASKHDIPLIADGGIKSGGDVIKALAAGADTVMVGRLLSGTTESPGMMMVKNGRKVKVYRGSSSFDVNVKQKKLYEKMLDIKEVTDVVPEGVEATVPYTGDVVEVINQLMGGLRSGMSYVGAKNLQELKYKAEFIKISSAGMRESNHHDVDV